jgi:2-dehydro-3-deoxygluconokinase
MIVAFGELMLRLAPPGVLRLRQALPGPLEASFAGAEANVCAALAGWGMPVRYITALPQHAVADAALAVLSGLGIDTRYVLRRAAGRLGAYFVETGANQRSSVVLYDRDHSAVSLAAADEYRFDEALSGAAGLHVTGITPAISQAAFETTLELVRRAATRGIPVSCDLNFRAKLWRWRPGTAPRELAGECMPHILRHVTLLMANEEDAGDVLGIHAQATSVEQARVSAAAYQAVAEEIVARFPNIRRVAFTLRESHSADHNNWGGLLYDAGARQCWLAPLDEAGEYRAYEIRDIVDRVGAGDAFAAGLLYAFHTPDLAAPQTALRYAVAASCLKHSVRGDFLYVTRDEVQTLMAGQASGRVRR